MKEAEKVPLVEFALRVMQLRILSARLSSVKYKVDPAVKEEVDIPTIYFANHSSMWDQHLALLITQRAWKQETYMMMSTKMMDSYPFYQKVGCFSVNYADPMDVARSLSYTKNLLSEDHNRVVWIFPQGDFYPNDLRPLGFQRGLALLVRTFDKVRLVPVAFRLDVFRRSKPEAYVSFGKPIIITKETRSNTATLTKQLEDAVCLELDQLCADILASKEQDIQIFMESKGFILRRIYTQIKQLGTRFRAVPKSDLRGD